jgi:hypothetical protein
LFIGRASQQVEHFLIQVQQALKELPIKEMEDVLI